MTLAIWQRLLLRSLNNIIKTIGNPVFRRSEILLNIEIPVDVISPYIVYVGSFKTQKRIDLLLETYLKVLKHFDVNLVIVGDGDENNNKKTSYKNLPVN